MNEAIIKSRIEAEITEGNLFDKALRRNRDFFSIPIKTENNLFTSFSYNSNGVILENSKIYQNKYFNPDWDFNFAYVADITFDGFLCYDDAFHLIHKEKFSFTCCVLCLKHTNFPLEPSNFVFFKNNVRRHFLSHYFLDNSITTKACFMYLTNK